MFSADYIMYQCCFHHGCVVFISGGLRWAWLSRYGDKIVETCFLRLWLRMWFTVMKLCRGEIVTTNPPRLPVTGYLSSLLFSSLLFSSLLLSYLILSYLILSYLILSYLILSYLIYLSNLGQCHDMEPTIMAVFIVRNWDHRNQYFRPEWWQFIPIEFGDQPTPWLDTTVYFALLRFVGSGFEREETTENTTETTMNRSLLLGFVQV